MNQMVRFGSILGVICLTATLVLAVTYEVTKPKIDAQIKAEEDAALKEVMPGADLFEAKATDGIEYFEALNAGALSGYCIKTSGPGYGGPIRIMVGIDKNGVIRGVSVLEQQETPGLGSKIKEIRPGEKEPYFLKQFQGKDARGVAVRKNIDAITGATISSKAVTDAINKTANEFFSKIKER